MSRRLLSVVALFATAAVAAGCSSSDPEQGADRSAQRPLGAVASSPYPTSSDPGLPDGNYAWSTLPVGAGGWATGLVVHPSEPDAVYVRTDVSGAYRFDVGSNAWVQMLTVDAMIETELQPEDHMVESLAVAPSDADVVYLAVGNDGLDPESAEAAGRVLRSEDGGRTWGASERRFTIAGNASHRQRSERLAVDPLDADHVVLGTRLEGVWRSRDGATTWQRIADLPDGRSESGDPAGVGFATWGHGSHQGHVWVGIAGEGVYGSADGGLTWQLVRPVPDAAVAPFEGTYADGHLVVAFNRLDDEDSGALERLDVDRGAWSDITPDHRSREWSVAVDPEDADRLLAAADVVRDDRIWRSTDGGGRWDALDVTVDSDEVPWVSEDDDEWMFIGRLVIDPHVEGRVWFAEGRGVWFADTVFDSPVITWRTRFAGLEQTVAADLLVNPDGFPVSALADHQGFLHRDVERYPSATLVDDRFAGGTSLDRSAKAPEHLVWVGAEYHRYDDPAREGRGAVSSDGGRTWTELPNLTPDHFGGTVAVASGDPDNIVWAPSYNDPWEWTWRPRGIFVTDSGGRSWTHLDAGVDGHHRFHRLVWWTTRRPLAADQASSGVFYLNDDEGNFWVSGDGGFDWESASHAPPCFEENQCHVFGQLRSSPSIANEVWASVGTDGLMRTRDAGASPWEPIDGVVEARAFDFGAPLDGSTHPTIYLHGRVGDDPQLGLWRSPDLGENWELIGRHPAGSGRGISAVSADPGRAGRVYVGTPGVGFLYGDDPTEVSG